MTHYKFVKVEVDSEETFEIPDEATNITYTKTKYARRGETKYEVEYLLPVEVEEEDE